MNPAAAIPNPKAEFPFLRGEGRLAGVAAFLLFSIYLFSVALVPIRSDNDCWWQVKSGQYIVQNGLPKHDVFSFTAADHEWNNHEWLSQILLYGAWKAGDASGFDGWRAVILFVSVILWLTYSAAFYLAARLSKNFWIALLITVLAVAIGRRMFYPRPPVVSNLLMMLEITLLVGINEGWWRRNWAFALIPGIAIWSNLHGGWVAGGVILGAWVLDQLATRFVNLIPCSTLTTPFDNFINLIGGQFPKSRLAKRVNRLLGVIRDWLGWPFSRPVNPLSLGNLYVLAPLAFLATLANPFGWKLYLLPARVMNDRLLVSSIGELAPPDYHYVVDFLVAVIALFVIAGISIRRLRPPLWEVLIYLFFLYQATQHVRHLFLFSVTMVPLAARIVAAFAAEVLALIDLAKGYRWRPCVPLAAALLAFYLGAWVLINPRESVSYPERNAQYLAGAGYTRARYPALLCDYIEMADLKGNMFNENYYGGYLIWRLSPEKHKVFSDSRFDIFGSKILAHENIISSGGAAPIGGRIVTWEGLLDDYKIQWAITRTNTGLRNAFVGSKKWLIGAQWPEELGSWEIWIRATPENDEMLKRARAAASLAGAVAPG